ncbi:MAG: DUF4249 domain-containing protein [Flavobacteriales bacterium]|nr:DUF4249 domain-containing protein [Flavobacteriales bacterium]MBK6882552.1 DUF4249 domain-containing protein [Flavobacteriales bacterium]MBK7111935.1 DUF4249 domain-containing protein [Flavobacteriales bacterium]MBK7482063.1 DUF4249 domain-containing protein [Flavobacteriales bacterium]MBK8532123.1 DUF4249 domain-containing protein [Flavobacteriales bacterium]
MKRLLPLFAIALLAGCEKEITVDLPDTPEQLVVEGTIEPGLPPFVILTRTQSYFEPLDLTSIANSFVRNAIVTVDNGNGPVQLDQVCSGSDLSPEEIALAAELTGLDPTLLAAVQVCIYTTTNTAVFGEVGRTYSLRVEAEDKVLTSVTTIPNPVPLDSVWFKLALQRPNDDSLGYAWGRLSDPDTMGNHYRWMARRISHRANGSVEDPTFISPLGNTFEDKFVNGLTFDFSFIRGRQFYSDQPEDNNEETGFFKLGDTIAVKFVSLGYNEHEFYTSYDENVGSSGDLFGTPVNAKSNIDGGLGIWAGWGVYPDTIICQ